MRQPGKRPGALWCLVVMCALGLPSVAQAQQWFKVDQPTSEKIEVKAQYRVRTIGITPLDLSGTEIRDMAWTEQRLRLESKFAQPGIGSFNIQVDALDAVLFGDNGSFGGDPAANAGVSLSSRRPNLARWEIGLGGGERDPLNPDSYVPVLKSADLFRVNFAYADVLLPVGLLRVGRQPLNYGPGLAAHDGGRYNRFGVSKFSDSIDRILLGTKLDEAFYMLTKKNHTVDKSLDNGLILGLFYDWLKQDLPQRSDDNLNQFGMALQWKKKEADWFGFEWKDILVGTNVVYLVNERFESNVFGFPAIAKASVNNLDLRMQFLHTRGATREVAEGFAELTASEANRQDLIAYGFQALADIHLGPVMLTLEFDYATGDGEPGSEAGNAITTANFARDLNVGLLLFEHVIAFESARSVAVGRENLEGAELASFPLSEASTEGRFTNAIAFFPQLKVDWIKKEDNELYTRMGALFAWPESSVGVVDQIMTTLSRDGDNIVDDAVNYHGGKPGNYYGTELDLQIGWKYKQHFEWMLEGAILFPGNSLQDEHGDAVNAFFVENRLVFSF